MPTIWRVRLNSPQLLTGARLACLSPEEHARAERFRFPEHALRWRVAHIALRELLAAATDRSPAELRFTTDSTGKPQLADAGEKSQSADPTRAPRGAVAIAPQFNLSHSGDLALVAIGGTTPLGVDVELIKPVSEMDGVAESHFAAEERAALWATPEPERLDAFYRCWTRKEAFVKATGIGVGPALSTFAVTLEAHHARLLRTDDEPDGASEWSVTDLHLDAPYVGALALRERAPRIRVLDWEPR